MAARSLVNGRGQPPSTPTKQRADSIRAKINDIIQSLNTDVGLGLVTPDPAATPSSRKQWADQSGYNARCNQIWSEFQYQYHQGDVDSVLRDFHVRAKKTFSGWVPKPRADPRTLPGTAAQPYRARDDGQAEALQELLREVLVERRKQMPKRSPRLFKKAASSGAVLERNGGASQTSRFPASKYGAKRVSGDENVTEGSFKRPRSSGREGAAKVSLEKANSDLDSVMVRESFTTKSMSFSGPSRTRAPPSQPKYAPPFAAARRPSPHQAEISSSSCYDRSANASSASLASASTNISAIFSVDDDGDALYNTQTTVKASSQEQKRTANPRFSKSAHLPPPSGGRAPRSSNQYSDLEPSLDELHAIWDAEQAAAARSSRIRTVNTKLQDSQSPSPICSAEISPTCSSPWSGSLVDALAEQAHMMSEPAPRPPQTGNTLQDRLDLVWRKCFCPSILTSLSLSTGSVLV